MGAFANLGALAGAASGWNEGSKRAEDQKQHKLDQEREERLIQLKNDMQVARDTSQQTHEVSQKKLGHDQSMELQGEKNEFSTTEREASQKFEASEGELDRKSREDIASETRAAGEKRTRPKFERGRTKGKETQNPDGSWSTEDGVPYVVNPTNKVTYLQEEGIGWLAEGKPKQSVRFPKDTAGAEKYLYDNPTIRNMQIYERDYGYIPKAAMGAHERYLDSEPNPE